MTEERKITRRDWLKGAIGVMVAAIGASIGLPAIAYVVGPALKQSDQQNWVRLGGISKIPLGEPTLFKFSVQVQTGWIVDQQEISVYILTDNGHDFVALSNVCTHLGCRVRWITADKQFFCPCHNAVFAKDGTVAAGPPPSPLDRFETKVEDDQLYILGG